MTQPTIVFDLDGTLADSARDLVATLNVVLAMDGLPPTRFEQARDLIGAGARPLIERGFALHGRTVAPARLDELYAAFLDHYHANIANETVLFEGVRTALDEFVADGWIMAVCTNKIEAHARTLLKALGVDTLFAAISGKDTFAWFKPDPRHLLSTIEAAGGSPNSAVMVGDSQTDIDTARAARIPCVAVSFGYTQIPVHDLGPDVVIDHFRDLWAATRPYAPRRLMA
ncbi:HAD family hydrolase [Terrarubrum flagellatum]|uniref:HAD family hydrolase n=1 Tax=Terrirubrum flagellatum TaxID=2895980 RepID=UPI003144DF3E